jgi:hypothetical protein
MAFLSIDRRLSYELDPSDAESHFNCIGLPIAILQSLILDMIKMAAIEFSPTVYDLSVSGLIARI